MCVGPCSRFAPRRYLVQLFIACVADRRSAIATSGIALLAMTEKPCL